MTQPEVDLLLILGQHWVGSVHQNAAAFTWTHRKDLKIGRPHEASRGYASSMPRAHEHRACPSEPTGRKFPFGVSS